MAENGSNGRRRRPLRRDELAPDVVTGNGEPATLDRRELEAEHVTLGKTTDIVEVGHEALAHLTASGATGLPAVDAALTPPDEHRPWYSLSRVRDEISTYRVLRATPYGIWPVIILGIIFLFEIFDSGAFSLAAPTIAKDLEINVPQIINILVIIGIFATLSSVFLGWYADRHARVPIIGIGTILTGIFASLTAWGKTSLGIGFPRVADEVTDQASEVPRFSLLADYYPPEVRGRAFALQGVLRGFGLLIVPAAAGGMVSTLGWQTTMRLLGVPLVIMGIVAMVKLREPIRGYMERKALGADEDVALTEDEPASFSEAWRTIWAVRTVRRLFIGDIFGGAQDRFTALYVLFFLSEKYNLSAVKIGLFLTPTALAAVIGGLFGGAIVDRLVARNPGRVTIVYGGYQILSAITYVGFAVRPPLWVLGAIYVVNRFFGALVGPAARVLYAQVVPPAIRSQGLQIANLASLPGVIFFGTLAETLFTKHGYGAVFLMSIPFGVVAGLLYMSAAPFFDLDARSAYAAALADEEWRRVKASGRGKMLVVRDVDVDYDGVQVLFGVDLDIEEGEIVALLGTNGAGKSTLLRAISGTQAASSGAVVFDGRDITHMPPHEIAGRGITHMPGGRGIFPELSVRENLLAATWLATEPAEVRQRLTEVFEIFPTLRERADIEAGLLSGGEQQQLSLAQAFLSRPRLLLIDELSLGLSPVVVAQLLEIVREIHRRGVTIVIVEQSVNVALSIAEKAVFMEKGEVKFFGPATELLERPDILRAVYVKGTAGVSSTARRRGLAAESAPPILEVEGLVKRYGGITAVDGVSLDLGTGAVLGLIGPNGAGKTTLFDLISGFQLPDAGTVRLQGLDITRITPEERGRIGLVRRFQDAKLFPALTVFETLLVALDHRLEVRSSLLNAGAMPQARRAERRLRSRAENLIELLELGSYRDKFIKELSTGLRRIVDLAAVFATEPKVLLLDEPSSGIAQAEAENLAPLLRRVRHETGCSILIIEHDMPLISAVSDELMALDQGRTVVRGTPSEVLEDERVISAYLGTSEAAIQRTGR